MTERKTISLSRDQYSALIQGKADYEERTGDDTSIAEFTKRAATTVRRVLAGANEQELKLIWFLWMVDKKLSGYDFDSIANEIFIQCFPSALAGNQPKVMEQLWSIVDQERDQTGLLKEAIQEALEVFDFELHVSATHPQSDRIQATFTIINKSDEKKAGVAFEIFDYPSNWSIVRAHTDGTTNPENEAVLFLALEPRESQSIQVTFELPENNQPREYPVTGKVIVDGETVTAKTVTISIS